MAWRGHARPLKTPAVYAGTAIGATLLGWGIGGLVGGTVADYLGRKRVMIFRERESRRRILLAFVLSLTSAVGWWAISGWLPAHVQTIAASEGRAQPDRWAATANILYTAGAVTGYVSGGFIIDAIGRRKTLVLTYAGALLVTPVTYFWVTSAQTMLFVVVLNGFFTLGMAFSWLAIYLPELFTPSVRSTAASTIFNGARIIAWVFPIMAGTLIQRFGGIPWAAMTLALIYVLARRPMVPAGIEGQAAAGVTTSSAVRRGDRTARFTPRRDGRRAGTPSDRWAAA